MTFGRGGLAAIQKIQEARRWLGLHLFKQARLADQFSHPESQEEMLLDAARCSAYREALQRTVKPGDVVVDMGAGTGLLSFFAAEAGARQVYAIEMGMIADVAAKLIAANGLQGRITLIRNNSTKVKLPELCDLLVTETLSSFCFDDENMVAYVVDARRRFLKPGARIIPAACDTVLMPFSSDEFGPGLLPARLYGLDYQVFRERRFAKAFGVAASGKRITSLGHPLPYARMNFYETTKTPGAASMVFRICSEGRLDGFLGWFDCHVCDGVVLSNAPHLPVTHWMQLCFPVIGQPHVRPGDTVTLHLDPHMTAGEAQWKYRVEMPSACP
jgi:SAM-dependent methyltransferase